MDNASLDANPRTAEHQTLRFWPNGLGWEMRTRYGLATVADCSNRLSVSVPINPAREPREGLGGPLIVKRWRYANAPIGTDPVQAIEWCKANGLIHREDSSYAGVSLDIPWIPSESIANGQSVAS